MKKKIDENIKGLNLGDLVQVEWTDASIGKSLSAGLNVNIPVVSWGIYLGLLGEPKHIIIINNNFHYSDGLCDLDYTAIPLTWASKVTVLLKNYVGSQEVKIFLRSFAMRRSRSAKQHMSNRHDRLD